MFKRSSHVAIAVPQEKLEEAVQFYIASLGVSEESRSEEGIELKGPNFTLWIETDSQRPKVLQEFVAADKDAALAKMKGAGATILAESSHGFYVSDPFGLDFHVYVGELE